ncbi:MAG TPA: S-layer homology domain-containing protein [Candidatus Paenibacillus intestinavium]|nr:S-layer homology domain-containing protein [Candidatus Paenibacillus intestinavium]
MRVHLRKTFLVFLLSLFVSALSNNEVINAGTETVFKDINNHHWAHNSIEWAVGNNVINGYPDQTFRPDNKITEAEFVKLIVTSFSNIELVTKENYWYDPYYKLLQHTAWKVPQELYNAMSDAEQPIRRGVAAQVMAATQGYYYDEEKAIQFLIDNNITKGKTSLTVQGYEKDSYLTRAEAVEFIYTFTKNRPYSDLQYVEIDILRSPLIPMYKIEKELVDYFSKDEEFTFGFSKVYPGTSTTYVFYGKDGIEINIYKEIDKLYFAEFLHVVIWKSEINASIDYRKYYDKLFELADILTKEDYIIPLIPIENADKLINVDSLIATYENVNNQPETRYSVVETTGTFTLEIQHNLFMMPEYKGAELQPTPFEDKGYRPGHSSSVTSQ